jgi:hypothetical protein
MAKITPAASELSLRYKANANSTAAPPAAAGHPPQYEQTQYVGGRNKRPRTADTAIPGTKEDHATSVIVNRNIMTAPEIRTP